MVELDRRLKAVSAFFCVKLFVLGGAYYCLLELLWRGRTHWTMPLMGGTAITILYFVFSEKLSVGPVAKCIACALLVTAAEFICGCIVNLWLGWDVWDYSGRKFNILGQICPLFTLFWGLLSIPGAYISRVLHRLHDITVTKEIMKYEKQAKI